MTPGTHSPSDLAFAIVRAGISVIPIQTNGSKKPACKEWKSFYERLPNEKEIQSWFRTPKGFGIICGQVSGNLEVLDIEGNAPIPSKYQPESVLKAKEGLGQRFKEKVIADGREDILKKVVQVESPSNGLHLYFRCSTVGRNQKLAELPDFDKEGKPKDYCMIETRAEGGYVIGPGSPKETHELQKPYKPIKGNLLKLQMITEEEREYLLSVARSFNQAKPKEVVVTPPAGPKTVERRVISEDLRPGDDYNERADWDTLLTGAGWRKVKTEGQKSYWCRPGKEGNDHSATLNCPKLSPNKFYPFSSNAFPFEAEKSYSKFEAYACLYHNGNHSEAASALSKLGYGTKQESQKPEQPTKKQPETKQKSFDVPTYWPELVPLGLKGLYTEGPEIPPSLLPDPLGDFCEAIAESTQTPVCMSVALILGAISTAVMKKVTVAKSETNKQWIQPVNIWVVVASDSGSGKSGVYRYLSAPIKEFEDAEKARLKPILQDIRDARAVAEEQIASLMKRSQKCKDKDATNAILAEIGRIRREMPEELKIPVLKVDNVTIEQFQNMLAANDEKMTVASAEGGIFKILNGMYNPGASVNLDIFLQSWGGESTRICRAKRDVDSDNPLCTFMMTVQPSIVANLCGNKEFREIGFLARFLFCVPKSLVGYRDVTQELPVPENLIAHYKLIMDYLLKLNPAEPINLYPSPEAKKCLDKFSTGIERQLREGQSLESLKDWAIKLTQNALRIAALFHVVKNFGNIEGNRVIEKRTMEKALDLCTVLIAHARIAFDSESGDLAVSDAKHIEAHLKKKQMWWISDSDLKRLPRFRQSELRVRLEKALAILQERYYLSAQLWKKANVGGQPTSGYYVSPHFVAWPEGEQ